MFVIFLGVSNLIQQVCRLNKGLRMLNLSKTGLSSKGMCPPAELLVGDHAKMITVLLCSPQVTIQMRRKALVYWN